MLLSIVSLQGRMSFKNITFLYFQLHGISGYRYSYLCSIDFESYQYYIDFESRINGEYPCNKFR